MARLLSRIFGQKAGTKRRSPRKSAPRLEALEGRLAPAIMVTTFADVVNPADGVTSLREAISLANARPGADVIQLRAGLYRVGLAGSAEDANAAGDFDVTGPLAVQGVGAGATIVDGARLDRLFDLHGRIAVSFAGLTLRNGAPLASNGGAINAPDADVRLTGCAVTDNRANLGGGIHAEKGDVTLAGCAVSRNVAQGDGGGVYLGAGALRLTGSAVSRNVAGGEGGGVRSVRATLANCAVSGNVAASGRGGGISATVAAALSNCTVNGNSVVGFGGGVCSDGPATLNGCRVIGNSARGTTADGGGVFANALALANSAVSGNSAGRNGGGLYAAAAAALTRCGVSGNSAGGQGGGVFGQSVALADSGLSGNSATGGGGVQAVTAVTLTRCTVSGNSASDQGGGVSAADTATLSRCTVGGNRASLGGGISAATARLTGCAVSGNSAVFAGGGIAANSATLTSCAVSGNSAGSGSGGGISAAEATLANCTVSGNSAHGDGGGIYASQAALLNVTVTDNSAQRGGGLFHLAGGGAFTVKNTIVAQNVFAGAGPDVFGDFQSDGHNLIGMVDGGSTGFFVLNEKGDKVGTTTRPIDARLAPLANNGGQTPTHALLAGSPAIDAGDGAGAPGADQRGLARPRDGDGNGSAVVDIGAFER
jgi:CSLREA domain-containing protein